VKLGKYSSWCEIENIEAKQRGETNMRRVFAVILTLAALAGQAEALRAAAAAPVRLKFTKSLATVMPSMTWKGAVNGDVNGDLETRLLSLRETGPIWHVEFDWIIASANPATSFTARLSGTVNTKTGKVVMNGVVIDGYLEGAQVHEEGVLTDAAASRFEGTIRVVPQTAD
jgi:hypothetical protein